MRSNPRILKPHMTRRSDDGDTVELRSRILGSVDFPETSALPLAVIGQGTSRREIPATAAASTLIPIWFYLGIVCGVVLTLLASAVARTW